MLCAPDPCVEPAPSIALLNRHMRPASHFLACHWSCQGCASRLTSTIAGKNALGVLTGMTREMLDKICG